MGSNLCVKTVRGGLLGLGFQERLFVYMFVVVGSVGWSIKVRYGVSFNDDES